MKWSKEFQWPQTVDDNKDQMMAGYRRQRFGEGVDPWKANVGCDSGNAKGEHNMKDLQCWKRG